MQNILISIDPSLTATGIAVFDINCYSSKRIGDALLEHQVVKTISKQPHEARTRRHREAGQALLRKYEGNTIIVIAEKQIYYPGMKPGAQKSVALCQEVRAIYETVFGGYLFETVLPATWQQALGWQSLKWLDSKGKARFLTKQLLGYDVGDHNACDAILIGVWKLDHQKLAERVGAIKG